MLRKIVMRVVPLALLLGAGPAMAQTRIITGKVTDSVTSEVVTSGQVSVVGTAVGATVRDDGTFTLAAPTRDVTITVRSIGFKKRTLAVSASENSVQVVLERDYFQLEAIVVTGAATGVERRNVANAVASVSAEQLVKQAPTASLEQALQGKLSGAQISMNSGAPGGGMVVRLRGITSIIGQFQPLYVVDGVITSNDAIAPGTNLVTYVTQSLALSNTQENPINRIGDLNPNDIADIEVLKGGSAAAIYGSKAANGVVLITTKRGRVGAPQFNLSQKIGTARVSNKLGERVFASAAEAQSVFGAAAAADWAADKVFDHEYEVASSKPLNYETSASMSGGTENTKYFASGLVKHDGGVEYGTFADKQALRLNLDQQVGGRLALGISSDVSRIYDDRGISNNENNGSSPWTTIFATPTFYDWRATCPDGSRQIHCKGGVYASNPYGPSNALATEEGVLNRETVWRFIGSARASYDVLNLPRHSLKLIGIGGVDQFTEKNDVYASPTLQFQQASSFGPGVSVASVAQNLNTNFSGHAVYVFKTSGGTSATTQAGVQYEAKTLNTDRVAGENLIGGINLPSAGTSNQTLSNRQRVKDFGLFAQEEFLTYRERLLVTLGLRADQSSNSGDPKAIYTYPKASVSLRVPTGMGLLTEVKPRFAFGASGNEPLYGQKFTELNAANLNGSAATILATQTGVTTLKPERQVEFEAGIDATLLKGRASLQATVYQKAVKDLLLARALEPSTGFSSQIFNGGSLRNRGVEVSLGVVPVESRNVHWSANFNFSLNRCKIDSLPVPAFPSTGVQKAQGKSCTRYVNSDSLGRLPGDAALGTIGSRIVREITDLRPDYIASWSNDLSYKSVKLYFLWDMQAGGWKGYSTITQNDAFKTSGDFVTPRCDGCQTGQSRVANSSKQTLYRSIWPSSYVKLREVALSWELPSGFIHRFWGSSRSARISVSGRNLFTSTPYPGMDPETSQSQASLASAAAGEFLAYPPSRTFFFSLDLGF